tara:strand:- start:256 stop:579 length:324 start_codon:yes stop_codon:yes gene_type:complete
MNEELKKKLKTIPFSRWHGEKLMIDGKTWIVPKKVTLNILRKLESSKKECEHCGVRSASVFDFFKFVGKANTPESAFISIRNIGEAHVANCVKLYEFMLNIYKIDRP